MSGSAAVIPVQGCGSVQLPDESDEIVRCRPVQARSGVLGLDRGRGQGSFVFASVFGDVFFQADDGFWYLDTLGAP
jgi:hypothetical protein